MWETFGNVKNKDLRNYDYFREKKGNLRISGISDARRPAAKALGDYVEWRDNRAHLPAGRGLLPDIHRLPAAATPPGMHHS